MRWGEAVALRVRRVDLARGRLEVVEAIAEVDGRLIVGEPKSYQRRSVPVPRFLRDELAVHLTDKDPDDLLFTSPRGETLRVHGFRRTYFGPAATAVGLPGLVPHELRHTAASLAIAAGASIKGVREMLGHASATLTLDRYGHLFGDELDAVAERLELHRADFLRTEAPLAAPASRPQPADKSLSCPGRIRTRGTRFRKAFRGVLTAADERWIKPLNCGFAVWCYRQLRA
jgi:integrase